MIESEDEIRQAIAGLRGRPAGTEPTLASPSTAGQPRAPRTSQPFRPAARPPFPLLTVFDDGRADGETIRIRSPRFVIGRAEGDLVIPLDGRISARHLEISLQSIGGAQRWVIADLQSRHGLFVRVTRAALVDQAEFLVGGGRYLFRSAPSSSSPSDETADHNADGTGDHGQTLAWDDRRSSEPPVPSLTEVVNEAAGPRTLLIKPEYWIGSDPSCGIPRVGDPFCDPRHARLSRSSEGAWIVEHDRTANGLWIRTSRFVLDAPVRFQIGEQRFQIKI